MQTTSVNWAQKCRDDLDRLCNEAVERNHRERGAQAQSPEARQLSRTMMDRFFIPNRRDCWAYVQAAAPIDVKRVIWEHEQDELIHDPRIGASHMDIIDFSEPVEPLPGVKTACYAWLHIAMHRPWLEALAASHVLERQNDPSVIKTKTGSQRSADELMKEMGIDRVEDLPVEARAHLDADTDHANLVWSVIQRYVTDEKSHEQVMRGARDSLDIFQTLRQALALAAVKVHDSEPAV